MEITINWLDAPRHDNAWDILSALAVAATAAGWIILEMTENYIWLKIWLN